MLLIMGKIRLAYANSKDLGELCIHVVSPEPSAKEIDMLSYKGWGMRTERLNRRSLKSFFFSRRGLFNYCYENNDECGW